MILNWVQDEYVDMRIKLTDDGNPAELKEGELIQFVSRVRTDGGAYLIDVSSCVKDSDGCVWVYIDLAELKAKPGKYRFEVNLITAEGKKQTVIRNSDGVLIISPKESL